jgi:hypothetical protein
MFKRLPNSTVLTVFIGTATYQSIDARDQLHDIWKGKTYDGSMSATAELTTPRSRCPWFQFHTLWMDIDEGGSACSAGGTSTALAESTGDYPNPYGDGTRTIATFSCSSGGGYGSATGSGTQFGEGESTGGETVSWGTGKGDGGVSKCGENAVVRYVCIDITATDGSWTTFSCGWATTCS